MIRILIGMDYSIEEKSREFLNGYQHIELRHLLESIQTNLTKMVADRELSLVIEEKEKENAIGLANTQIANQQFCLMLLYLRI